MKFIYEKKINKKWREGSFFKTGSRTGSLLLFLLLILNIFCFSAVFASASLAEADIAVSDIEYIGYGANRTVSGSLHIIKMNGEKIILDAGTVFEEDRRFLPELTEDDIEGVSAVLISHAHLDHIGRLFKLFHLGYDGPIYTSGPTAELLPVMLAMAGEYGDYGEEDFYFSKGSYEKNSERGKDTAVHRYQCEWGSRIHTANLQEMDVVRSQLERLDFYYCNTCLGLEVDRIIDKIRVVPPLEKYPISEKLLVKFYPTPHLPGAVSIRIEGTEEDSSSLLFSGDLGSGFSPFLAEQYPLDSLQETDLLITEGTYGTNSLYDNDDERKDFRSFVGESIRSGKRVIIPAFALDRSQQVLYELVEGKIDGSIPKRTPIRIYSPSIARINNIYQRFFDDYNYEEYFSEDIMDKGYYMAAGEESYDIDELDYGEIAISTSGMADTGFARGFVESHVEDEDTTFVFVGYQSPDTPGRILTSAEKDEQVVIGREEYVLEAEIAHFHCFSGHAYFDQISDIIASIKGLDKVLLVHTDEFEELEKRYEEKFPGIEFVAPVAGEEINLKDD